MDTKAPYWIDTLKRKVNDDMERTAYIDHHADILNAIIESSFDGLWICDAEGKILKINRASEKINGISEEQVIGKNVSQLVEEGFLDRSVTLEVLKKKERISIIQNLNNGKKLLVTGNPIFIDEKLSYVLTNDRDITELIRLKEELEESRQTSRKYLRKLQKVLHGEIGEKEGFVFCSKGMKGIYEMIQKVSEVDVTVLLQGESGVGKSRIAHMIHEHSYRQKGAFIHVNCGAIPETLLESELFGYVKGAFTGAKKEGKPGVFEMANGGTLFLDEITEMPVNLQVKLLHVLDKGTIRRIGDIVTRDIDARIIAASNRDIHKLVNEKRFREDLFFRINIVPLKIPALRQRIEDIPLLLTHFLKFYNTRYKKSISIAPEIANMICQYSFPGNIRELSNLIERLVVMVQHDEIGMEDIPNYVMQNVLFPRKKEKSTSFDLSLKGAIHNFEKEILKNAIKLCKTQQDLANLLGVSQPTIARKLRQHGLIRLVEWN